MNPIKLVEVEDYVEKNIDTFHQKRLQRIQKLKLYDVLKRKNPYLFKAKNIQTPQDLVKSLVDAYLSSQEETIFGDFLEGLAIFINGKVYGGRGSTTEGIDLEFENDNKRYIVSIKSGPNWGNSSQISKMRDNFRRAKQILRARGSSKHVIAINGCCYGRVRKPDKGDYFKYCGQVFWEFISGNNDLYAEIVKPLGYRAKEKNEIFIEEYARSITKFTYKFTEEFCCDGLINWKALVQFNSSKER